MSSYAVRPKADEDLDGQAFYYAANASAERGHRFLVAAHHTFSLLASQPGIGWPFKLKRSEIEFLRVFPVAGFESILIVYVPLPGGVDSLRVIHGSRNIQALFPREKPN